MFESMTSAEKLWLWIGYGTQGLFGLRLPVQRITSEGWNLALIYRDRGRLEQALHHLQKTAALVPDEVEVRLALNEVLIALRSRSENAGAR